MLSATNQKLTNTTASKSQWMLGATTYTVNNFTKFGNAYYAYEAAGKVPAASYA